MYKLLYYYIKKYWYYEYFPISCDNCAKLNYFTPKYNIFLTIGNISYIMNYPSTSLHHCILAYKYNNYFLISRDYCTDFTYLTQNNWNSPITVSHCPILVQKTPLYHNLIEGICSVWSQRDDIKKYGYYKYFLISCDFCTKFDCFTPKYQISYIQFHELPYMQNVTQFHLLT